MPKSKTAPAANDAFVFDVTTTDFEEKVLKASVVTPILVDFWAPWCGPCKQLTPTLEQLVRDTKGAVLLAKVNVDENPELSQAFRIQSLPTVLALFGGQPVTGFMGAQPASQIKAIIDQLIKAAKAGQPEMLDIPTTLKQANDFLAQNNFREAHNLYADILQQDPENVSAYVGIIRAFLSAGQIEEAKALVDTAPEKIKKDTNFASVITALELAQNAPQGDSAALEKQIAADATNNNACFELAQIYFARGRREDAINLLLGIIKRSREWEENKAKTLLFKYFEAIGIADPLTIASRKKLSTILFS